MSVRDFRCVFSGVSLLGSEVAVVLLQRLGDRWCPAALPLFGLYEGACTVSEVSDGPNAEMILSAVSEGRVEIDFDAMGLASQPVLHIETFLELIACSQLHGDDAVRSGEGPMGFALLSAHVAAALMNAEPELPLAPSVENLAEDVFESSFGRQTYRQLGALSHRLRCKFGLSMVGLAALDQSMKAWGKPWSPPGPGIPEEEADPALWLTLATVEFAGDEALIEALEDHAGQGEEAL